MKKGADPWLSLQDMENCLSLQSPVSKTSEQSGVENNLVVSCRFLTCHTESCGGCQLSRYCNKEGFGIASGIGTKWVFHMP